ncbi:hypothetical protein HDU91_002303 [Kappamyces sp. JEL0680]|nr:hypothetical protein HDU91_002303 [Kappamyces sp. JEL0680]
MDQVQYEVDMMVEEPTGTQEFEDMDEDISHSAMAAEPNKVLQQMVHQNFKKKFGTFDIYDDKTH